MPYWNFPTPPYNEGDTYADGQYIWTWREGSNRTPASTFGYWEKTNSTTRDTGVGDTMLMWSDAGDMAGYHYSSYDKTANTLTIRSMQPSEGTQGPNLLAFDGDGSYTGCDVTQEGLFAGELANGSLQVKQDGEWVTFTPGGGATTHYNAAEPTTPPFTLNDADIWIEAEKGLADHALGVRGIHSYDNANTEWDRIIAFPIRTTAAPAHEEATSVLGHGHLRGDIAWFGDGTATPSAFIVMKDNSNTKYYEIAGPAFDNKWLRTAPTTVAQNTITGAASTDLLTLKLDATPALFMDLQNSGTTSIWEWGEDTLVGSNDAGTPMVTLYRDDADVAADNGILTIVPQGSPVADSWGFSFDGAATGMGGIRLKYDDYSVITEADDRVFVVEDDTAQSMWITRDGEINVHPRDSLTWSSTRERRALHGNFTTLGATSNKFELITLAVPTGAYGTADTFIHCTQGGSNKFTVTCDGEVYSQGVLVHCDAGLKTGIKYQDSVSRTTSSATLAYQGLDTIAALTPASFFYTGTSTERLGFIADDMVAVSEGLIQQDDSGTNSVDLLAMVAALTNAVQELKIRLEALEVYLP